MNWGMHSLGGGVGKQQMFLVNLFNVNTLFIFGC